MFSAFDTGVPFEVAPWLKRELRVRRGGGHCFAEASQDHLREHPREVLSRLKGAAESQRELGETTSTDCISEGQNLQDCDCLVNYDIHWNPVRIIQRFGRIDA